MRSKAWCSWRTNTGDLPSRESSLRLTFLTDKNDMTQTCLSGLSCRVSEHWTSLNATTYLARGCRLESPTSNFQYFSFTHDFRDLEVHNYRAYCSLSFLIGQLLTRSSQFCVPSCISHCLYRRIWSRSLQCSPHEISYCLWGYLQPCSDFDLALHCAGPLQAERHCKVTTGAQYIRACSCAERCYKHWACCKSLDYGGIPAI